MPRGRMIGSRVAGLVAVGGGLSAAAVMTVSTVPLTTASSSDQAAVNFARAEVAYYGDHLPAGLQAPDSGVDTACFSATDDQVPADANSKGVPTNPAWFERDALNQYCATLRLRDQYTSPAFGYEVAVNGSALWLDQLGEQIEDGPGHIHGGITTLVPGSQAADPFRTVSEWEARTGGHVIDVAFPANDGAQLRGHIWLPPPGTPTLPNGKYPGVVITDGSVQGYENLYYWAAEGLAQYGYEVMTYDVQGEGDSDLLPAQCTPSAAELERGSVCPGVPYQQNYNFSAPRGALTYPPRSGEGLEVISLGSMADRASKE